jgi:hypothetical protein
MYVFADCEFTDFIECELISIALVTADGREFYAELSDYDDTTCSTFVREAVLPQLGRWPERIFTRNALRNALLGWLGTFGGGSVCVDDATDWDLLLDVVGDTPTGWHGVLVGQLIDQTRRESFFAQHGGRHHALYDARALRASMPDDLSALTVAS